MLTVTQLTDWVAHVPKEVLAKNFQTSIAAFDHIPAEQLYIFPGGSYHSFLGLFSDKLILGL